MPISTLMTTEETGTENREAIVAPALASTSTLHGDSSNEATTAQERRDQHQNQSVTEQLGLQQSLFPPHHRSPVAVSEHPSPAPVPASLEASDLPSTSAPISVYGLLLAGPEDDAGAAAYVDRHDDRGSGSDKVGRHDHVSTGGGSVDDDDFEPSISSSLSSSSSTRQSGIPPDTPDESVSGA